MASAREPAETFTCNGYEASSLEGSPPGGYEGCGKALLREGDFHKAFLREGTFPKFS